MEWGEKSKWDQSFHFCVFLSLCCCVGCNNLAATEPRQKLGQRFASQVARAGENSPSFPLSSPPCAAPESAIGAGARWGALAEPRPVSEGLKGWDSLNCPGDVPSLAAKGLIDQQHLQAAACSVFLRRAQILLPWSPFFTC